LHAGWIPGSDRAAKNPDHRSDKRGEKEVEDWKNQEWLRIKTAETEALAVMFVDEAGFYQLPAAAGCEHPVEKRRCLKRLSATSTCRR